jgi:HMG (high mobility group) box
MSSEKVVKRKSEKSEKAVKAVKAVKVSEPVVEVHESVPVEVKEVEVKEVEVKEVKVKGPRAAKAPKAPKAPKVEKVKKVKKLKKERVGPKKNSTGYMIYCNAERAALRASDPTLSSKQLITKLAESWQALKDAKPDVIKKYEELAAVDKVRFLKEKAEFEAAQSQPQQVAEVVDVVESPPEVAIIDSIIEPISEPKKRKKALKVSTTA